MRLRYSLLAVAALVAASLLPSLKAQAGELDKVDASVKLLPDTASYYSSLLRNKEQLDILMKSKAVAKIRELPAVKKILEKLQKEGKLNQNSPEAAEILSVFGEATAQEIFIYGGESWIKFIDLVNAVNGTSSSFLQLQGLIQGQNPENIQTTAMWHALASHLDLIRAPDLIVGFKIKDQKKFTAHLDHLEKMAQEHIEKDIPELKGRLKRGKVGDADLLTLNLDGTLLPLDTIKEKEEKEGEFDALIKKLKETTLTVNLGIKGDYLILAVGPTTDVVNHLGTKGPKLSDRAELKPIAKHADKPIVNISYVSKAIQSKMGTTPKDIDELVKNAKNLIEQAPIAAEQQTKLIKDIGDMATDIKKYLHESGAAVSYSFLTNRGYESFSYNYAPNPNADSSKPLTFLDHIGNPIYASVNRSKHDPKLYETFTKWVKVFYGHAEEIGLPLAGDEVKQQVQGVKALILPFLARFDEITGKKLIPSLGEGQSGFVLDSKWSSKQWNLNLPATEKAMPMLEVAFLLGVSDPEQFKAAVDGYRDLINDIIALARNFAPNAPDLKLQPPLVDKQKNGTLYSFPLNEMLGMDKQVEPTIAIGSKIAILSLSTSQASRLLEAKPFKPTSGPLLDNKNPLIGASVLNWPAFIDTVSPWVEFGIGQMEYEAEEGAPTKEEVVQLVRTLLDVAKCFKGSTSASYIEGGATVTHTESLFEDVK
jgi:hypothetical protein